jgi:eukaryotic-like serine/threonine-protein kinase
MMFNDGKLIHDKYEIDRFLGEGAFAEVYRVKHKFMGRQAMKVFKSPSASQKEIEEKLSEALILSRIGHRNIIKVFDADIVETPIGNCGYFTMEYVAGGSLDTFWRSFGPKFVPILDAVDITRQICMGMSVAHSEKPPIIHRDIKPQNILVGYDFEGLRVRIADFGLAKKVNPLTLLASARGTPAFKPPECLSNVDSCAGDVWAIGVTLYLLLTDRLPFPIESTIEFSSGESFKHALIPVSNLNAQVDDELAAIVARCLEKKPEKRYPDAMSLLAALNEWQPTERKNPRNAKFSADQSKSVLGLAAKSDHVTAEKMINEALNLSQDAGKLIEAADLMEEALNKSPKLRDKYEYQLQLWRRGIAR